MCMERNTYELARKKLMLSIMIDKTIVVPFKDKCLKSLKLSNSNKKYIGEKIIPWKNY